jgi:hypothetical protein
MNNLPLELIDPDAYRKKTIHKENSMKPEKSEFEKNATAAFAFEKFMKNSPSGIIRYVQSTPIPIPLVAQACEEYRKLGWEIAHVLPFGLMKVSSLTIASEQNIPAFVIIMCKEMEANAKIELPEVKIGGPR